MRRALLTIMLILSTGIDTDTTRAADATRSAAVRVAALPAPVLSLTRHTNGELFFLIDDAAPPATDRAARPRRVRVYWDHSASRADDDLGGEIDLLLRYLDSVRAGIVDLVLLSSGASELLVFEAPYEEKHLAGLLGKLSYDGAAPMHALTDLALPPADICLYFSDGATSVEPAEAQRTRCPLFVLSSSDDANRGLLRVLARRGAGGYLDLRTLTADDAIAQMTGGQPRVLSVTSSDGRATDYALLPSGSGRFRMVGKAPASGEIIVSLASGANRTITRAYTTQTVRVQPDDVLAVQWAMDRLYEFCASREPDVAAIAELARRYAVDAAPAAD
jgi:hypothetical protein